MWIISLSTISTLLTIENERGSFKNLVIKYHLEQGGDEVSEQRDQGEHQQGDEQEHRGSDTREVGVRVAEVQLRSLDTTHKVISLHA